MKKRERILSFLLVVLVFLSSMSFEEIKINTDSEYATVEISVFYHTSANAPIDADVCSMEMLQLRSQSGQSRIAEKLLPLQYEMRLDDVLCAKEVSYPYCEEIKCISKIQKEHVAGYIHKSDGKKRSIILTI